MHRPVATQDTCGTGCPWPHSGLGAEPGKRGLLVKRTELGLPPQPEERPLVNALRRRAEEQSPPHEVAP